MIDLPGIIEGAKDGRGRGRQVIAVAKTCHLIFIVLDVNKPLTDKRVIETELEGFGIRINKGTVAPLIRFVCEWQLTLTRTTQHHLQEEGQGRTEHNEHGSSNPHRPR